MKTAFISKQGKRIAVRFIKADEPQLLLDLFAHMGDESRYQRFLQTVDHVSKERLWEEAAHIAQQSEAGDVCLGGFVVDELGRETLVGAARYMFVAEGKVEIAISIRDDYQNEGIGRQLLGLLLDEARQNGVTAVVATVHNENERMLHLLYELHLPLERVLEGSASVVTLSL